ncbi:hypothetical protein A5695_15065 [Mycobacterium sp. E1747]|nr:hypothetical protein A5695_15065 [Mycobacterium sp. E1747]
MTVSPANSTVNLRVAIWLGRWHIEIYEDSIDSLIASTRDCVRPRGQSGRGGSVPTGGRMWIRIRRNRRALSKDLKLRAWASEYGPRRK